jgi:23S rRNA (guanosine2251-2'-O)-methyltransferase
MKSKMIFGFHAVTARLRHEASSVEEIYVDAGRHDPPHESELIAQPRQPACGDPVDDGSA